REGVAREGVQERFGHGDERSVGEGRSPVGDARFRIAAGRGGRQTQGKGPAARVDPTRVEVEVPSSVLLSLPAAPALGAELQVIPEESPSVVQPPDALPHARQESLVQDSDAPLQFWFADPPQEPLRQQSLLASRWLDEMDALGRIGDRHAVGENPQVSPVESEVEAQSDIDGLVSIDLHAEVLAGGDLPSYPALVPADFEACLAD